MKYRIVEYYGGFEVQVKYKIRWYPINENYTNTIEGALEILNDHRKKYDTRIITVYKTDIKDIKGRKTNE